MRRVSCRCAAWTIHNRLTRDLPGNATWPHFEYDTTLWDTTFSESPLVVAHHFQWAAARGA